MSTPRYAIFFARLESNKNAIVAAHNCDFSYSYLKFGKISIKRNFGETK